MMGMTTAAREAVRIGLDRFKVTYQNDGLNSVQVAKRLGCKPYLLPFIAQEFGLPTRKQTGQKFKPTKQITPEMEDDEAWPVGILKGGCELVSMSTGEIKAYCRFYRHCTEDDPVTLPCEAYVFLWEKELIEKARPNGHTSD